MDVSDMIKDEDFVVFGGGDSSSSNSGRRREGFRVFRFYRSSVRELNFLKRKVKVNEGRGVLSVFVIILKM